MGTLLDLTDDERTALTVLLRDKIATDRFPFSPRLAPLKSVLVKLDPPKAIEPRPPLTGGPVANRKKRSPR